ncbi:MAG TPA: hypothetical protein VKB24_09490 [Candidatus Acidoferrum sp.]|nr:hypothetical protein [Candidatus Acidoferrum sp.]
MALLRPSLDRFALLLSLAALLGHFAYSQQPPPAKNARILLLPRTMVSGDRTTLAVLDFAGRLTPNATVAFSNGDHVTTNATGRATFVAPLTQGVLYATIQGRPGRAQTLVIAASSNKNPTLIERAPHFASLSDRFELQGHGFCGDADKNVVQLNGHAALVLASSSESLAVLPPGELDAGPADVSVSCNKGEASWARVVFLELGLEADASTLKPGEKRTLTVRVSGTTERVGLEARNLAPGVAELAGGNPARATSSGGARNTAAFPLTGRQRGKILVSIRLLPGLIRGQP